MGHFSTFLFARPSFFEGAGRILDFGNTLWEYNWSDGGEEADARAFSADYAAIGEDIKQAIQTYGATCDPESL